MSLIKIATKNDNDIDDYHRFNRNVATGAGVVLGGLYGGAGTAAGVGYNAERRFEKANYLKNATKTLYDRETHVATKLKTSPGSQARLAKIMKKIKSRASLKTGAGALIGAAVLGGGINTLVRHEQKHEKNLMKNNKAKLVIAR